MAKPRVFVSSTYYDLKYVRERIEQLINSFCLEPILFESDNVYFENGKPLDVSCYNEVHNCHLMILIVNGRYGSLATTKEEQDSYDKGHVSITQKEYITAKEKGIPVMVFVDKNVLADYRTYQQNKISIPTNFKFAHTDTIKVFEFISILESSAIKAYDKIDDIEHYFANQISGMLFTHLTQLQYTKEHNEMKSAIEYIKFASSSMREMTNSIAEKVLENDSGKYQNLIEQQNKSLINFFLELFKQSVSCKNNDFVDHSVILNLKEVLLSTVFDFKQYVDIKDGEKKYNNLIRLCDECIEKSTISESEYAFTKIEHFNFASQLFQIGDIVYKNKKLTDYLSNELNNTIEAILLPF